MEKDLKYTKWLIEKMYDEGLLTVDFNQASCPVQDTFEKWMRDYGNEFLEELRASQKPETSDEALPIADVVGSNAGWISTSDHLPPEGTEVLMIVQAFDPNAKSRTRRYQSMDTYFGYWECEDVDHEVTHWRPMIELPSA